jgi:GNAT superfamily N-acetyltransferase
VTAFERIHQGFEAAVGQWIFDIQYRDWPGEYRKYLQSICKAESGVRLFVVEHGSALIGFVSMSIDRERRVGQIGLNAIHPDRQGKGFGRRMYDFVLDRMKEAGAELAYVSTGGDSNHAPARAAYEKAGFDKAIPSVTYFKKL